VLPSVNLLDGKAKQFDDGLYAALDQAYYRGLEGKLLSHVRLVRRLFERVGKDSPAAPFLAAGLELAGERVEVADGAARDKWLQEFRDDETRSKPAGFYTWNEALSACFRFLRFFQYEFGAGQLGVPVRVCDGARDAVAGADIVVTATNSPQPVLRREWLAAGTHVNAVGACVPRDREIDTTTMAEAALFADSRESVRNEAGDYLLAEKEGAVNPVRAEIGELLIEAAPGRAGEDEITLFESLGLAAEDLAAASYLYEKATRLGAGTAADF